MTDDKVLSEICSEVRHLLRLLCTALEPSRVMHTADHSEQL